MATESSLRVKRREIILLSIVVLLIFGVFRSSAIVDGVWQNSISVRSVVDQQPLGVGGKPVFIWLGRIFVDLGSMIWNVTAVQSLSFLSTLFGVLSGINVYFVYRSLFKQRYIGTVASLLLALSPWYFQSSTSPERYAVSLFFITGSVWAWTAHSWLAWGVMLGLALASHASAAILMLPFAGSLYLNRASIVDGKKLVLGGIIAIGIAFGAVAWMLHSYHGLISDAQGLALGERLGNSLKAMEPVHIIIVVAYVVLAAAFAYVSRKREKISRYGLAALLIAIPYLAILYFSLQPVSNAAGAALTVLAILAVPALWPVEQSKGELAFLLLWLAPPLVVFSLLNFGGSALYGLLIPPLTLLACRLLDRSLDGQWLDFWWALGLPSNWYYRLAKMLVLGILALSFYQTTRA